ncbi:MAG: hypothetical protein ABI779_09050, partial [Acidobacteriota bacterium]
MFTTPPEPLTPRQKMILAIVTVLGAASRLLAFARSPWDWDEALFTMALRDYDVTLHHPHPPGFPVYIALAKVARLFLADDFRALQGVNLVAAMLVFPAVFLFARELRMRFGTAVAAGALFAVFPNVWFFGGGAFSDIPSIVLVLFAVTLLFRGARSRSSYWWGTLLLALAIGIRPQNFLVGLVPGLLASRKRRPAEILVALLIGVIVVAAAFGGAIEATGSVHDYLRIVREHGQYIARVDSFQAAGRPPLWRLFDRFFVYQYQGRVLSTIASLFVALSIAGSLRERDRSMLWNALTFVPFALFAWLMLDRFSIGRFSIGYQPMFALLLADGIRRVTAWRAPGERPRAEGVLAGAFVAAFCAYTIPALTPVRNEIAPSIVAAQTMARRLDPKSEQLFVGDSMRVFLDLVAPTLPYTRIADDRGLPVQASGRAWLLAESTSTKGEGLLFRRERGSLWNITRRHYFSIKLAPLDRRAQFPSGWQPAEASAHEQWRWMGERSTTVLPPAPGPTSLFLRMDVPEESVTAHATITVTLNGRVLARIPATALLERELAVTPAPAGQ